MPRSSASPPVLRPRAGKKPSRDRGLYRLLLLGYVLFLVYGSLYPISSLRVPPESPWLLILRPTAISKTDALTNLLVYLPLGWFLARVLSARSPLFLTLLGSALSLGIEYLQAFLPGRVPSLFDWTLNAAGTFLGAQLARRLHFVVGLRDELFLSGAHAKLGLLAVLTFVLSELFPFVPSADVDYLKEGLRPLWYALRGEASFSFAQSSVYGLSILSLSLVLDAILRPERRSPLVPGLLFPAVLAAKVPILTRQLSLEAALGVAAGLTLFGLVRSSPAALRSAALAAVGAYVVDSLRAAPGAMTSDFNWIPLRGHLVNELTGIGDILEGAWPFLVLAFVVSASRPREPRRAALVGGLLVFFGALSLEWIQKYVPGRSPDVTDALLALLAWSLPWLHPEIAIRSRRSRETPDD